MLTNGSRLSPGNGNWAFSTAIIYLGSRLLPEHQLQAVAVGVLEIDAMIVAGPAGDADALRFELGFEPFVGAAGDVQREVVHIAAGRHRRPVDLLEQRDTLRPACRNTCRS